MRHAARAFWLLVVLGVALALAGIAAVRFAGSDGGRAFIVRQLPLYAPKSGLTVRAGRIEGSIFGAAIIHDVALGDQHGVFARAPQVHLDWQPFDLARNRLSIRSLVVPDLVVLRRPALRPSGDPRILPAIDIAIGALRVDRLDLAPGVAGAARRVASLSGSAASIAGNAHLVLDAAAPASGDRLALRLDAAPDADRFDLDAAVTGPRGGALAGLLGIDRAIAGRIAGDGSWSKWTGTATASAGGIALADLRLTVASGRYGAAGRVTPGSLLDGVAGRLAATGIDVDASATVTARRATIQFSATTPALALTAAGPVDFAAEMLRGVVVDVRLPRPAVLSPRFAASDLRLRATLAGRFAAPLADYTATATRIAYGTTFADRVRATGIVDGGRRPLAVPVMLTAARGGGFGAELDALLSNLRVAGVVQLRGATLTGDGLDVRTDRLTGRVAGRVDLGGGGFAATLDGRLPGYVVPGVGVADIAALLRAVPDRGGARVAGRVTVSARRVDGSFFAALLGGLPTIVAPIVLTPDGVLTAADARLTAPALSLTLGGSRAADGIVHLTGQGVSRRYGPVALRLAGPIATPVVDLVLARPDFGIGLAAVAAHIAPAGSDWTFDARGATRFGALAGKGLIRTGTPVVIDIADATLAGIGARGSIAQTAAGPFAGRLALTGGGLTGTATLGSAGAAQRFDLVVDATGARVDAGAPMTIGHGHLEATAILADAGPIVTGIAEVRDLRRQGVRVTAARATLDYHAGRGSAHLDASGLARSPFALTGGAEFAGDRVALTGGGSFDKRRVGLDRPAILTHSGGDWVLAPAVVVTPDGRAEISGRFGATRQISARFDNLGLSLLTMVDPALDFGGRVSGTIDLAQTPGALPRGTAALRIAGLSRAGLASASLPIDVAVNAGLDNNGGTLRAVLVRGGVVEGRLQAALRGIPGDASDPVMQRLRAAPLFAQARYAGPAQAIWPLAGIEALDVRGPLTIAADIGGRLGQPTLTGTIASDNARVENATLGTVVEKLKLDSRFTASRLDLTRFSGEIGKGGSISGSGSIGFAADQGFPLAIDVALKNAEALKRDDLSATVTGDLHVRSGRDGGTISGKLVADRAKFRIGRASAAEVPVLAVREVHDEALRRPPVPVAAPTRWGLDIAVDASNRVIVEGMGLQSDWRGALTIGGTATAPALTGRVRLIRGDYDFAGKRFQLTRGDLRFQGLYPPDPIIDIAAENTSANFTATLTITGTGLRPDIAFGSIPALPQDEVLSRVLFGSSIATLSAPEALQLAGALASLRGGGKGDGLNPINFVRKHLGIDRLRVLPADTVSGRRTSIAAGQYIGRRVYVELASDAQGYAASNLEVSLTRSLSILSQVATQGGTSVNLRLKKDY